MNPNSITETDPVSQAEKAADSSLAKFESAMENLADKVESTTQQIQHLVEDTTGRVQHIVEVAQRPVDDIRHLQERVRATAAPIWNEMRRDPRPWVMTAVFVGAALLVYRYLEHRVPQITPNRS